MKSLMLTSKEKGYDGTKNYGDCAIIIEEKKAVIFDCGSEEHAKRVKNFLDVNSVEEVYIVLSHNDADHFNGIKWLRENIEIKAIYTTLLLKYIDEIYEKISNKRMKRETVKERIKEYYDNIYSLSGENLKDIFEYDVPIENISIVGPSREYLIEAVAKHLDGRESDNIDGDTIFNAISIQLEIEIKSNKVLLTGDATFEALEDKIEEYDVIQLPHHGRKKQALQICDKLSKKSTVKYLISDNTENSNGGSDNLTKENLKGKMVFNTKDGQDIDIEGIIDINHIRGNYGY